MVRERSRVARADVGHAEPIDEELRELERPGGDTVGVRRVLGDVRADVGGAGARRGDDELVAGEGRDEPLGECLGDVRVAGVQVQLAAAGLLARESDLDAEPLEQRDGRAPDGGVQRVGEARDEERDAHGDDNNR